MLYNKIFAVTVTESNDTLSFSEPPKRVHEFGGAAGVTFDPFDITPDGKTTAVIDEHQIGV